MVILIGLVIVVLGIAGLIRRKANQRKAQALNAVGETMFWGLIGLIAIMVAVGEVFRLLLIHNGGLYW